MYQIQTKNNGDWIAEEREFYKEEDALAVARLFYKDKPIEWRVVEVFNQRMAERKKQA